jgi:hypothetical protein
MARPLPLVAFPVEVDFAEDDACNAEAEGEDTADDSCAGEPERASFAGCFLPEGPERADLTGETSSVVASEGFRGVPVGATGNVVSADASNKSGFASAPGAIDGAVTIVVFCMDSLADATDPSHCVNNNDTTRIAKLLLI